MPVPNSDITCQCFETAAGTNVLGDSFTNTFPGASLSDDQPVQIGSIFCSDAAGVKAEVAKGSSTSTQVKTSATARIQMNFSGEGAVQGEVPVDGSIVPTKGLFASPIGTDAIINSASGIHASKVSCQAFSDVTGKKSLGKAFNDAQAAAFAENDVPVGAFSCEAV